MFEYEPLLAIIFRLTNFGILVFLCVYAFRRYLLPVLKDQIKQEEKQRNALKEKQKEMRKQEKSVAAFAQEQAALCAVLKERVVSWRRAQDHVLQRRSQEKERRTRYLQDKVARQEHEFAQQKLLRNITPQAAYDARIVLQKMFADDQKERAYTNDIIAALRKGKS